MQLLEQGFSKQEILNQNLPQKAIDMVVQRIIAMEFKRKIPEIAPL